MDINEKKKLRSILFRHLDGIAIIPTVHALNEIGIINFIKEHHVFRFTDLQSNFKTNGGYLNVALRLLASQGWLNRKILLDGEEIDFTLTKKGMTMLEFAAKYSSCANHLHDLMIIEKHLFKSDKTLNSENLLNAFDHFTMSIKDEKEENSMEWEFQKHLEGLIMGPILVSIGMSGIMEQYLTNSNSLDPKIKDAFPLVIHFMKLFNAIK